MPLFTIPRSFRVQDGLDCKTPLRNSGARCLGKNNHGLRTKTQMKQGPPILSFRNTTRVSDMREYGVVVVTRTTT